MNSILIPGWAGLRGIRLLGRCEPVWLNTIFDFEEREMPGHGESVHIFAPNQPGQRLDATLALFCGTYEQWDCETLPPFSEDDIARLLGLMDA